VLAREHRLRKASDIARVYKKGAYGGASGVLSVKALYSGRATARLVVVVGKKVDKRAVVRNRLRRRILGDIQPRWATLRAGYDIVITVHSDLSSLSASQLRQHLAAALTRAGVYTSSS
jgi:ribonuclease P protein component